MSLFNLVSKQLKEVHNIEIVKENYDAYVIKRISKNDELFDKVNNAIVFEKEAVNIFPYIKTPEVIGKFRLQIPFKLFKVNLEYVLNKQEELNIDNEFEIHMLAIRNDEDKIFIGESKNPLDKMDYIKNLIEIDDLILIMKVRNDLQYEIYIIKKKDIIDEINQTNIEKEVSEIEDTVLTFINGEKGLVNFKNSIEVENKKKFKEWIDKNRDIKEETFIQYIKQLDRFINYLNQKEKEKLSYWLNPIKFIESYSKDEMIQKAKSAQKDGLKGLFRTSSGGTAFGAGLAAYYEWANLFEQNIEVVFSSELKNSSRQVIYFGAPGTGKSYQLKNDSELFFKKNLERVTFHPNMSYGQFIGAFKPFPYREQTTNESKITYKFVPGVLMKLLMKALSSPNEAFLLIIEEINRANVSAVFGDFFQLLDRDETNISEYPIAINEDIKYYLEEEIYINSETYNVENIHKAIQNGLVLPSNLFLWGTMNSSDQGVLPMDTAFKRRWEQKYFGINQAYENNKEEFKSYSKIICGERKIQWNMIREFLNKQLIKVNVPEDKLMGPYFISKNILNSSEEMLTNSFKNKVLMYLFEDAGKQYRRNLFNLAPDKMIYSEVIKAFDEIGLELFKESNHLIIGLIENDSTITNDETL